MQVNTTLSPSCTVWGWMDRVTVGGSAGRADGAVTGAGTGSAWQRERGQRENPPAQRCLHRPLPTLPPRAWPVVWEIPKALMLGVGNQHPCLLWVLIVGALHPSPVWASSIPAWCGCLPWAPSIAACCGYPASLSGMGARRERPASLPAVGAHRGCPAFLLGVDACCGHPASVPGVGAGGGCRALAGQSLPAAATGGRCSPRRPSPASRLQPGGTG